MCVYSGLEFGIRLSSDLAKLFLDEIFEGLGRLPSPVVERLPLAQDVTLGSWDRVPHRAPCMEPASPSASVSASLSPCVSQE